MNDYLIKECTLEDIEKVKVISEKTFYETFAEDNTEEDMKEYLKENFSYEKVEGELKNKNSKFYIIEYGSKIVGYMKVNFDKAQTEEGYENSLEVQRIYILEEYKGKKLGKRLINKAIELGKKHKVDYLWLGVWEHNYNAIKFYEKMGFKKFDTHIFILGEDRQTDNLMKLIL